MPAFAGSNTGADRELHLRMAAALLVLLVTPFALVYSLLLTLNTVGPIALGFLTGTARPLDIWVDPRVLIVGVTLGFVGMYVLGPRFVVSSLEGRRPWADQPAATETVEAMTTKLASQVDIRPPDVIVLESEMPNALAVGTPRNGRIAVTTGLLDVLEPDELRAVLAHEVAHIANRDATVMTMAWVVPAVTYALTVATAGVLVGLGRSIGPRTPSRRRRAGDRSSGTAGTGARPRARPDPTAVLPPRIAATVAIAMTAVATLAISVTFWIASGALYRILAQYREFTADRGAAAITGSPVALASALRTLDEEVPQVPDDDLRRFDGGTEALYVVPLDPSVFQDDSVVSSTIFPPTHPPTTDRIEWLGRLVDDTHT